MFSQVYVIEFWKYLYYMHVLHVCTKKLMNLLFDLTQRVM